MCMQAMPRIEHAPSPVLWFGNVPESCDEEMLWDFIFSKTGCKAKRIHQGKRDGKSGWAFVEFESQEQSDKARNHAWGCWEQEEVHVVVRLEPM